MQLVKLERQGGHPIYVNPMNVISVKRVTANKKTSLQIVGAQEIVVDEDPEDVVNRINQAMA